MIIYTTTKNLDEAKKIAKVLVEEKLVACVNIIPNILSFYRWKNEIKEENEIILLAKTNEEKVKQVEEKIKELHSYELPAIITIESSGSEEFLKWINQEVE